MNDKLLSALLGLVVVMLFFPIIKDAFFDDRVDVEIYRNDESGNMIYCETGSLNDEFHTYMGSGKISAASASAC